MDNLEGITKSIDWISTIKDVILILLSAIAIFSSYLQHVNTKRSKWIDDFRAIIAKLITIITTQMEKNDIEYHKDIFEHFSLITLYLDQKNALHSKLLDNLKNLKADMKDFKNGKKDSSQVSVTITELILTSKKIINAENNKIF